MKTMLSLCLECNKMKTKKMNKRIKNLLSLIKETVVVDFVVCAILFISTLQRVTHVLFNPRFDFLPGNCFHREIHGSMNGLLIVSLGDFTDQTLNRTFVIVSSTNNN